MDEKSIKEAQLSHTVAVQDPPLDIWWNNLSLLEGHVWECLSSWAQRPSLCSGLCSRGTLPTDWVSINSLMTLTNGNITLRRVKSSSVSLHVIFHCLGYILLTAHLFLFFFDRIWLWWCRGDKTTWFLLHHRLECECLTVKDIIINAK